MTPSRKIFVPTDFSADPAGSSARRPKRDMHVGRSSSGTAPVHPLSALVLALADWCATGLNIATSLHAYWAVVAGCALTAGAATFLLEWRRAKATVLNACIKAACVAALVSIPFPFAGTLVASVLLTWSLYDRLKRR